MGSLLLIADLDEMYDIQLDEGDVRTLLLVPAEAGSGDLVEAVVLDDL